MWKTRAYKIASLAFWVLVWQLISMKIGEGILFVSPLLVFKEFLGLFLKKHFYVDVLATALRVLAGFSIGAFVGVFLGIFSYKSKIVKELLQPFMNMVKVTPVVSFIVLALIFIKINLLPVLIVSLIVAPLFYFVSLGSLKSVPKSYLDLAKVFKFSKKRIVKYIYMPRLLRDLKPALSTGIGFAFKSGLAAEVLARPGIGLGHRIYEGKVYMETSEVFTYTFAAIILSVVFEKLMLRLMRRRRDD